MDRFIRVDSCYICPWNRSKLDRLPNPDGVHRTECGITQDETKIGRFKECPPLTLNSPKQPIPDWCPLEVISKSDTEGK